jgi:peptidoglycan/xylan/chitin deacetylase (PgdA/CDA1 family)
MEYLKKNRHVVPLSDVIKHFRGELELSRYSVAVSFDDGYRDNYDNAYPVLRSLELPATVFLTVGYIGSSRKLWWERVLEMLDEMDKNELQMILAGGSICPEKTARELISYTSQNGDRTKLGASVIDSFKLMKEDQRIRLVDLLDEAQKPNKDDNDKRSFLSWAEIKEMAANNITFGSHTMYHPILTQVTKARAREEIQTSKSELESGLKREVAFFAYPDGMFNSEIMQLVAEAGYEAAFATSRHNTNTGHHLYALGRRRVGEGHSMFPDGNFSKELFEMEISGLFKILFLRKRRRRDPFIA